MMRRKSVLVKTLSVILVLGWAISACSLVVPVKSSLAMAAMSDVGGRTVTDKDGRAADLVVVGPVVTMAAGKPNARGLAVTGGKIAFVGDAASARKRLRPGGRLIVLEPGQVVIPGLVDAHVHMLDAGLMLQRCPLDEASREPDGKMHALKMIAECSERAGKEGKEWIIGSGWSL